MADEPKRFDPLVQTPTLDSLSMDIKDLQDQVKYLMQRRITQADVLPDSIKQRAVGEGVRFVRAGLFADRPAIGETTATGQPIYWATDTHDFYAWDGSVWVLISGGLVGDTGVQGNTGVKGDTGTQGDTGIPGTAAAAGNTGVQGNTGVKGDTGAKGDTGSGATGVTGNTGVKGDTGVQGDTGVKGDTGVIPTPNVTTTAINYNILTSDNIIKATANGITITLPTAVGVAGKIYTIDNSSAGNITVNTTSSQTIEGNLTQTIPTQSAMDVYSDNANWRII